MKHLKHISILLFVVLALLLLITPKAEAATVASGECGENLTWTLDDQGTLTISGTGAMSDWTYQSYSPWLSIGNKIKKVVISNGVTSIGDYAFYYLMSSCSLNSVEISQSVTSIGQYAFAGCKLTSVIIPEKVTSVGQYAFLQCNSLTTVTIMDGVTAVGLGAFANCSKLENIDLPDNMTNIGDSAFSNTAWYNNQPDGLVYAGKVVYRYKGDCPETVTIQEGTIAIAASAFNFRTALKSVEIPNSVKVIGDKAFWYCESLTSVVIPDSVTDIGSNAFEACKNLKSVKLGRGLKIISAYAFSGTISLTAIEIPDGVTTIAYGAFCSAGLKSVIIPNSVTDIGEEAFAACVDLKNIKFEGTAPHAANIFSDHENYAVHSVAYYPANDQTWSEEVQQNYGGEILWLPDSVDNIIAGGRCGTAVYWTLDNQGNMTVFGSGEMSDGKQNNWLCLQENIKKVTIEDGVTSISWHAFFDCTAMTELTIGIGVKEFGGSAFSGCTGLTKIYFNAANAKDMEQGDFVFRYAGKNGTGMEVIVGKEVTRIPAMLFYPQPTNGFSSDNVPNLLSVEFENDSVCTSIGEQAFSNSKIVSVSIPQSVTSIGLYAFSGCSRLTQVNITDLTAWCAIDFESDISNPVYYAKKLYLNGQIVTNVVIDEKISKLRDYVFCNYTELESVTIKGEGVIIGNYAFYQCSGLTSFSVQGSVESIGNCSFAHCANLTSVTIPDSITTIGDSAFVQCSSLATIDIPDSITTIGESAFNGCSNLKTIDIPNGTKAIGAYAFHNTAWYDDQPDGLIYTGKVAYAYKGNCPALVTIQDGTVAIAGRAFQDCSDLMTIEIPDSVTNIGDGAFCNCVSLTTVDLPDNVTAISDSLFYSCTGLETVIIPQKVTRIGDDAFCDCRSLIGIDIPEGVTYIGACAFRNCIKLEGDLIIPNSVITIGYEAFCFCTGLSSVTIGNGVKDIGSWAFAECSNLRSLTIGSGTTNIARMAFGNCKELETIYFNAVNMNDLSKSDSVFVYAGHNSDGVKVIVGAQVTRMPAYLFGGFDYAYSYPNLVSIEFERGGCFDSIGAYAFRGCTNLKEILFRDAAPSFEDYVFGSVIATVYYPANDATWTEEVRQNYGGTITWVGYEYVTEGVCGEGVYWSYDEETRILTIYAQQATRNAVVGAMTSAPWKLLFGNQIKKIVIEEGVVSIAEGAFDGCSNLETVTVAKTVENIGSKAFANCTNLKSVTFEGSAPTVDNTVFEGTDTTIYYPAEDDTWDDDIKENIGNATVLVPVGGTQKPEKFDIDVARMILGNSLEFQFGVAKSKFTDMTGVYAVIEKQWPDGTTTTKTIPASQWGTAGQYWAIVYDELAAKEMADALSVTIYNAQGEAISNTKTDSARSYVMRSLGGQTAKGKTMMVDMLNYGAAAQTHFNYNIDDLANNQLTEEQKAWGTQIMKTVTNNLVTGTNYKGTRLVLEGRIQMQVAFTGMNRSMYAVYSYTNHNGKSCTVTVRGADMIEVGNLLGVELSELVYADARQVVTIEIYNENGTLISTVKDSMESYIKRSGTSSALNQALMKFADSAKVYLHQ